MASTSRIGMCSVRITTVRAPASIASIAAVLAASGGINITAQSKGVSAIASLAVA